MPTRDPLRSHELYAILDHAFRARRKGRCTCRVPVPYLRQRPDAVSANWTIGSPPKCVNGCHLLVAEILAEMWTKYDLVEDRAS
jgi:hypothetical protein